MFVDAVADPGEGVAADGTIRTGAHRGRVPEIFEPGLAAQLGQLHSWAERRRHPAREEVERALADAGIVFAIVQRFGRLIGLWADDSGEQ